MSSVVRPRGRKPAAVYWRRRLVLLGLVGLLVYGGQRWVGGDDGPGQTVASEHQSPGPATTSAGPAPTTTRSPTAAASPVKKTSTPPERKRVTTRFADPRGTCEVGDVAVVPDVEDTHAGGPVPLRLGLTTMTAEACTLRLLAADLALEVTSGDDLIWRFEVCPDALEPQSLTLRRGWITHVEVAWDGRRAVDECVSGEAARPGYYWAEAALVGGEPDRAQFRLTKPPMPKPQPQPKRKPQRQPKPQPAAGENGNAEQSPEPTGEDTPLHGHRDG